MYILFCKLWKMFELICKNSLEFLSTGELSAPILISVKLSENDKLHYIWDIWYKYLQNTHNYFKNPSNWWVIHWYNPLLFFNIKTSFLTTIGSSIPMRLSITFIWRELNNMELKKNNYGEFLMRIWFWNM